MADKTLVIKIKTTAEGAGVISQHVSLLGEASGAQNRLQREMRETTSAARTQSSALSAATSQLKGWIVGVGGAIAVGRLFKEVFTYNQEVESTANSIAGLYFANKKYTTSTGEAISETLAWAAAQEEARGTMSQLQVESLKTSATVPQIGDAYATTYGAIAAAGAKIKATDEEILQLTVRLTQAGNAFKVPMEQMNQEVNSLVTAQITEDSKIAKRLGLDNASVKEMQANGTFVAEVLRRTDAYAKAAEAQSNTLQGKIINTTEAFVSTLSRAFDPLFQKAKGVLDSLGGMIGQNAEKFVTFFQRVIAAGDELADRVREWAARHRELLEDIGSVAIIAGVAAAAYGVYAVAVAVVTSPIAIAIGAIVALAIAWRKLSQLSEMKVNGQPVAPYIHATFAAIKNGVEIYYRGQWALMAPFVELVKSGVQVVADAFKVMVGIGRMVIASVQGLLNVVVMPFRALGRLTAEAVSTVSGATRSVVSAVSVVPKALMGPVNGIAHVMGIVRRLFATIVESASAPARKVIAIFSGIAQKMIDPFLAIARKVFEIMSRIPDQVLSRIPGGTETKDAVISLVKSINDFVTAPGRALGTQMAKIREEATEGAKEIREALKDESPIPDPSEVVRAAWDKAKGVVDGMLPELGALGGKAADALSGILSGRKSAPAKSDPKATEKLRKDLEEYLNFIGKFRDAAEAEGDPLAQALAAIKTDRDEAIRKLEQQHKELKGALSLDFMADKSAIDTFFDRKAVEASSQALRTINDDTKKSLIARNEIIANLTVEGQRRATEKRLALISDEIEREHQERLAANAEWLEAEKDKAIKAIPIAVMRLGTIAALEEEKRQRDDEADVEAQRRIRERTLGTTEYWKKLAGEIKVQFRSIGQIVADTILEIRVTLANSLSGFLDDFIDGQQNFGEALGNLSKGLAKTWTRNFTDILFNGKGVVAQLKTLFNSVYVPKTDKEGNVIGTDYLGTAGAGAGFGGMVGGLFQTDNNYAGVGGAIGGGLGAAIGAYFGGAAGAKIGMMIGTAIGTAIGSVIQKGQDWIKVAIKDGVVTVTEKGISFEAAQGVRTQIARQVKEQTKSWQSILDMFPESVQAAVAKITSPAKINVQGAVESADITDEGALGTLNDFLSNKLPAAAFAAYRGALSESFRQIGVGDYRIDELFAHWGTLQGKELQDAVRTYVETMLGAIDIRDKMKAPLSDRFAEAQKRSSATALSQIDDLDAKLQTAVASMTKLTDIDDIVAAQQQINQLGQQRYEMEIQYLQRINQISKTLSDSIASQKEGLQVSGMSDQGKLDFFFDRMSSLRTQLEGATDPEEISRLTQQIQQYVSQASGVASDNPKLREKLLGILDETDHLSQSRLSDAVDALNERDLKPATALQTAADMLMKAASDLSGVPNNPSKPADPEGPQGDPPIVADPPDRPRKPQQNAATVGDELTLSETVAKMRLQMESPVAPTKAAEDLTLFETVASLKMQLEDSLSMHRQSAAIAVAPSRAAEDFTLVETIAKLRGDQERRNVDAMMMQLQSAIAVAPLRDADAAAKAQAPTTADVAKAMGVALGGVELTMVTPIQFTNSLGAEEVRYIENRVIARVKADASVILPRT